MNLVFRRGAAAARLVSAPLLGRRGSGIPPGGPFDSASAALANIAAGNPTDAPVLELLPARHEIVADEPCWIALHGAAPRLYPPRAANPISLQPEEPLVIADFEFGARLYLAAPGGFFAQGEGAFALAGRPIPLLAATPPFRHPSRRLMSVGVDARFAEIADAIAGAPLHVGVHSDRRGVRLEGALPGHRHSFPSKPVAVGSMQWTPAGEIIVVGPDGPTIGGYPCLGYLCEESICDLAQLLPGDEVRLEWIPHDEALRRRHDRRDGMRRFQELASSLGRRNRAGE